MRYRGIIRAILRALTLVSLTAIAELSAPASSLAGGPATAESLVDKAQSAYGMECGIFEGSWSCGAWPLSVAFTPETGEVTQLFARSDEPARDGLGESGHRMFVDFLDATCSDPSAVVAFVDELAALTDAGQIGPISLDRCDLAGGYMPDICEFGCYHVSALVHNPPPPPTATPTPQPTPEPTPEPTPQPTPQPTTTATPSPGPGTPSPMPLPTPVSTSSPTPTPSPTASPDLDATSEPTSTPTPRGGVLAGNPTPRPSPADEGSPVGSSPPAIMAGAFVSMVPVASGVSTDPGAVAGSAMLALVLLLFVAFAGELFNSTLEGNYDEVAGWFAGAGGALGGLARIWRSPLGVVAFLAASALTYALLDPGFAPDLAALATYLGLLLGLVAVLVAFELPGLLLYRRRTGELPGIRALPWTLPAAIVCVVLSRVAELEPAYLYGILLGLVFRRDLTAADDGRQAAAGALWTLIVALLAWFALEALRPGGVPLGGFPLVVAETALAVIVVGGLEAVALGLFPMRFLAGAAIYGWSRKAWALLFAAGIFAFLHVLVGPETGYLAELDPAAFIAACGAFAAFGAVSVTFWAYFRFRPVHAAV